MDGVERGTLEQLVARNPEGKSVLERAIEPNAAHFAIIFARGVERHRIAVFLRLIDQLEPGRFGQGFMRLCDRNGAFEFRTDRHRMGTVNRDAHASDRGAEFRQMHDAPALVLHFHFFFRVAARQKGIDVRQNVERDRMRIDFRHRSCFSAAASTCDRSSLIARAPLPETA